LNGKRDRCLHVVLSFRY